jgi:hypothetical protein
MAKFYIESGRFQTIVTADDPHTAAVRAVGAWSNEHPLAISALLALEVAVNEQGFGRADGAVFDTFEVLAAAQGMSPREFFLKLALGMAI